MGNALRRNKIPLSPTGIYPEFLWEKKVVRRMIQQNRVAPFFTPYEEPKGSCEECPICMNFFIGGLNSCVQCKKRFCSECYFQVRKPTTKSKCPICMHEPFEVRFSGPLSSEEVKKQKSEEEKVNELLEKVNEEDELPTPQREEKELTEAVKRKVDDKDFFNISTAHPSSEPPKRMTFPSRASHYSSSGPSRRGPRWRIPFRPPDNIVSRQLDEEEEENEQQRPVSSPIEDFVPRNYLGRLNDPTSEERMLREAIRLSLQESSGNNNENNEIISINNEIGIQEEDEEEEDDEEINRYKSPFERILFERMKKIREEQEHRRIRRERNNPPPPPPPPSQQQQQQQHRYRNSLPNNNIRSNPFGGRRSRRVINFFDSSEDEEEEKESNNNAHHRNNNNNNNEEIDDINRSNDNFEFGDKNEFEDWINHI